MEKDALDSAIEAVMGATQIFGVTTFDSTFKHVMQDCDVCLEFVKKIAKLGDEVRSVTLLDDSMNPIKELANPRDGTAI